jgi:methyl-accepting chemotaxis protein
MVSFQRIAVRLGAGFGALLLVFTVSGALTGLQLWRIDGAREAIDGSRERSALVAEWIDQVNGNLQRAVLATRIDQSIGDSMELAQTLAPLASQLNQDMADAATAAAQLQERMLAQVDDPDLRARVEKVSAERNAFVSLRGQIRDDLLMGEGQERIDAELMPRANAMQQALLDLRGQLQAQTAAGAQRLQSSVANTQLVMLVSGVVALLAGVVLAVLLGRSITTPIKEAVGYVRNIAQGDLTQTLDTRRRDELGDLQRALGEMRGGLVDLMGQVRDASQVVALAATEIARGNQDLSSRTETTASNLQETAASMEELGGTMRQSADAARQANQLAVANAEVANRGGQVVSQVVSTMDEISHSSRKINDIISVIDGIAFQTNILALNAAVEAARAGEQGRGFAVVAGEVRNLAQRSAEAARQIKGLIDNSVEKVETGSRLVAQAGSTIGELVGSAQRVAAMIAEITETSGEQSQGIGQVGAAVAQLDQMTQQNAALVEESAAAAESLRDQASRLAGVVATFRLDR